MRKVTGVINFNVPFPERFIKLVEITPPDEVKAKKKFMAEAIKSGRIHPRKRPKAILKKA